MSSAVGSILRAATRRPGGPLNILTSPTHEAMESNLAQTGHNFFAWRGPGIKDWNTTYRPLPKNYTLLDPDLGERQLPPDVDFDLVVSQNRFGQFQALAPVAARLHLPLVTIEHTAPLPEWPPEYLQQCKQMRGHANGFISEWSRQQWGWGVDESFVIHHGIDSNLFKPDPKVERKTNLLSIVNDWVRRDQLCGYQLWREVVRDDLPVSVLGATPGLSKPAKDVHDLIRHYQTSAIFLNTSLVSPIPMSLLEAMSSGCACISTKNSMIPEIIEHGTNGLLSNDPKELRAFAKDCLKNPALCHELGRNARRTILERFSLGRFVREWDQLFRRAADTVFVG